MESKGIARAFGAVLGLLLCAAVARADVVTYSEIISDADGRLFPSGLPLYDIGQDLQRRTILGDGTVIDTDNDALIRSENGLTGYFGNNLIDRFGVTTSHTIGWTHTFTGVPDVQNFVAATVTIKAYSVSGTSGGYGDYDGGQEIASASSLQIVIGNDAVSIDGEVVGTLNPGGPFATSETSFTTTDGTEIGVLLGDGKLEVKVFPSGQGFLGLPDQVSVQESQLDVVYRVDPPERNQFFITFGGPNGLPYLGEGWNGGSIFLLNTGGFSGEFPSLDLINSGGGFDLSGTGIGIGTEVHHLGAGFFPGFSPHLVLGDGDPETPEEPIDPLLQAVIEQGLATAPEFFGIPEGGDYTMIPADDLINHILVEQVVFGTEFTFDDVAGVLFPGEYVEFNTAGEASENIFAFPDFVPHIGLSVLNIGPNGTVGVSYTNLLAPVPEPGTLALLVCAGGLALVRRRRRRRRRA